MQNVKIRKCLAFILTAIILVSTSVVTTARSATNYAQQYSVAQGMLYDLQDRDNLTSAKQLFEELGTYKNAKHYTQYVNAILALYDGDLPAARKILQVLSQITPFTEELTANELPVCETLALYASARLLESGGDTEGARKLYIEANVLDAVDRAVALADQQLALEPISFAPKATPAPALEKELADQKLELEAANQDSGIYLTWNNLEGVAEYEIYWRRTKETKKPFVKVSKLTQNSFTHTAEPRNGFKYTYYVEAVSASGQRIKSNEVQIVCRSGSNNGNQRDNKTRRATPQDPGRTAQPQVTPSSGQGTGHSSSHTTPAPTSTPRVTARPVATPAPVVTPTPSNNNDGGYGENPLKYHTPRPVQTPPATN